MQLSHISRVALGSADDDFKGSLPGTVHKTPDSLLVRCSTSGQVPRDDPDEMIIVGRIKPAGGKEMSAAEWWNGRKASRVGPVDQFI